MSKRSGSIATRVTLIYGVLGIAWIFGSDRLLAALPLSPELMLSVQSAKGTAFVLASTALIYSLIRIVGARMRRLDEALRTSEIRLFKALSKAGEPAWEFDVRSDEVTISPALHHLVRDTVDGDEGLKARLRQAASTAAARLDGEELLLDLDFDLTNGRMLHLLFRGSPLPGLDGIPTGFSGLAIDVTEKKQHQQALERSNRLLRGVLHLNRLVSRATTRRELLDGLDRELAPYGISTRWDPLESPVDLSFPIEAAGIQFGWLCVSPRQEGSEGEEERMLLEALGQDIGHALWALEGQERLGEAEEGRLLALGRMQAALLQSVSALSVTIEKRDPYTAGHQQRVAEIAVAIAERMGLDGETVQGIRLGALMHDIGKIGIPAEILTRPGRLSAAEFELVKSHSTTGFEIVRDIDFPWPLARIVLEHHERLDGRGYPQGLTEEEICTEAKIVAVADVLEAITSHRPYRPALGLEVAIAELRRQSGTSLDADAVKTCIELIESGALAKAV